MTREEMIEYLLDELKEEREKMLLGKDNKYSYIFMLCNDMGIIPEDFQPDTFRRCNALQSGSKSAGRRQRTAKQKAAGKPEKLNQRHQSKKRKVSPV